MAGQYEGNAGVKTADDWDPFDEADTTPLDYASVGLEVGAANAKASLMKRRVLAKAVDLLLVLGVSQLLSAWISQSSDAAIRSQAIMYNEFSGSTAGIDPTPYYVGLLLQVAVGVAYLGYFPWCESMWGATLGKRLFSLSVRTRSRAFPSFAVAAKRNALVSLLGLVGALIELPSFLTAKDGRRLGDKWADTKVVDANEAGPGSRAVGTTGDTRPCPYCAEPVRTAAVKCKHCGSALEPVDGA